MKTISRAASVMLVLAVIMMLAVPAFAAGSGSITVDNPRTGETYTAYKIFDVVYNADQSAYSYTIASDSPWLSTVQAFSGINLSDAVTDGDGNTFYIVEENNSFSAAEFAKALKSALSGKTGTQLTLSGGKATATGLDLGYYFVSSTNGALCNLTTTNPNAIIYDKNDVTFDKTVDDVSVEVGQTVEFTLLGKIPDTTGFTTYVYEFSDTMSSGLTFQKDVKVYVNGVQLTENITLTNTPSDQSATGFTLSIDVMKLQSLVAKEIKVIYTAKVNENAVSVIQRNKAVLKYSNDPTDNEEYTKIPDEEKVYTAKIVIDKFETDHEDKKLAGAQFVLMNASGKFYAYDANAQKVSWVDDQDDATVATTDSSGAASFIGLEDGVYTLKEIKAPAGYNLLTNTIDITIAGSDADETKLTVEADVANSTGSQLPSTGGIGTTIFYTIGGVMMGLAVILLIVKKRTSLSE